MTVRHVLWDADGVTQRITGGWRRTLEDLFGESVDRVRPRLEEAEAPALSGDVDDFTPALAQLLSDHGATTTTEEAYARLWLALTVDPDVAGVVGHLRDQGIGVHLGSNQHARRARYMDDELGYAARFDRCFYSCRVGVAKPDPGFFRVVVAELGVEPDEVLFVDDLADNVEAAAGVGLNAERWDLDAGLPRLHALLAGHGLGLSAGARGTP